MTINEAKQLKRGMILIHESIRDRESGQPLQFTLKRNAQWKKGKLEILCHYGLGKEFTINDGNVDQFMIKPTKPRKVQNGAGNHPAHNPMENSCPLQ